VLARPEGFEPPTPRFVVCCLPLHGRSVELLTDRGSILEFVCGAMTDLGPGRDVKSFGLQQSFDIRRERVAPRAPRPLQSRVG
jgi:hypothetical protein